MADDSGEWIDVCGDGGLLKKILVEGDGPSPSSGKVKVHYVGTLTESGEKFDSSRDRNDFFNFDLGKGQVIKGWDKGVATMKVGEKCILRCRSDYGYGDHGSPPKIPGGASLDFEVELFDFEIDCSDRTTEENLEDAIKQKEKGNADFKAGQFGKAARAYQKGCNNLEFEIEDKDAEDLKEAFGESFNNTYITLYANLAMAKLKLKQFQEGVSAADKVLERDDKHLKALCRRAQCLAQLGRYAEAEANCEAALAVDQNNATAKQILKFSKGKVAQEKKKMKKMASRMFGGKAKKKTEEAGSAMETEEKDDTVEVANGGESEI